MNTKEESTIQFLSIEDILQIHNDTIQEEGGRPGLRDLGLLQSAAMMPQQQFGGDYLHPGLAEKAAAYLYHLSANHPSFDGNKRTATFAALIFLYGNGIERLPSPEELEQVTWAIADGTMSKPALREWLRAQIEERSEQE